MDNVVVLSQVRAARQAEAEAAERTSVSGDITRSTMVTILEEFKSRGFNVSDPTFIEAIKSLTLLTKGMVDFTMQNDTNTSAYFRLAFDQVDDYLPKIG